MAVPKRLALIRTSCDDVEGFLAELPGGKITKLTFGEPIPIAATKDYPASPYTASIPYYVADKGEILWTSLGEDRVEGTEVYQTVNCWRLTTYLGLQSFANTGLYGYRSAAPSILRLKLEGDQSLFAVGVAKPEFEKDRMNFTPSFAQKLESDKWATVECPAARPKASNGAQSELVQDPNINVATSYVFNLRASGHGQGWETLAIDQIRASYLRHMQFDPSFVWQRFNIDLGFSAFRPITYLFTGDRNTMTRRLYFFKLDAEFSRILVAWVNLRKDGSIASYKPNFRAHGTARLSIKDSRHPQGLKAIDLGEKRVLLMWEDGPKPSYTWKEDGGNVQLEQHPRVCKSMGKFALIGQDGSLPDDSGWQDVEMSFTSPPRDDDRRLRAQSIAAVVVSYP